MSHKYLTILFALPPLINGCIVSEDTIVNGGTEAGTIAGMTAGTVMGGTPCEPGFGMVEPVAKPALDLPEGAEAPQQPPNDCRFNECGNRETCELTHEEEICDQSPPFEECLCDEETGEVVCQEVSPSPYCYTEVTYECVPVLPPTPSVDECNGVPNPSVTCLQTGCDEGFSCLPTDDDQCIPSNCFCEEDQAGWACTEDCRQSFACVSE